MPSLEGKERFIQRNKPEIKPVLEADARVDVNEKKVLESLEHSYPTEKELDTILERFETKVFVHPKEGDGKNVLVTFSDPGSYATMLPLIEALEQDPRAKAIEIVEHGVKSSEFAEYAKEKYTQIRKDDALVMQDIGEMTEKYPPEVMLATLSSQNGPENPMLAEGKEIFGAKKIYLVADGWQAGRKDAPLENVDGIFCNDELAKKMLLTMIPDFPESKIFPTGTPQLESLEVEKAGEYETEARAKLGISENALVCMYNGGIQSQWVPLYGTDPAIETTSFTKTLSAFADAARGRPGEEFVLLVRPHPRDPESSTIYNAAESPLPENAKVVSAASLSPNEAAYASDIIVGIVPSEVFLAPARGKQGAFLEFETGDEKKVLDRVYGNSIAKEIRESKDREVISTQEQLTELLKHSTHTKPQEVASLAQKPSERILTKIFEYIV